VNNMTTPMTSMSCFAPREIHRAVGRPIGVAVLTGAALIFGVLAGCGKADPASSANSAEGASKPAIKPSLTVALIKPEVATWSQSLAANGTVAPWQEVVIGAELSSVRIEEVLVNVGDWVRKGQVLAYLRKDGLGTEVNATRSQWTEAVAVLAEARSNAERARKLKKEDAISDVDAQRAFTAEQQAQARVEALKAQMAGSQIRLGQSVVTAPDDGVISARSATMGAVIQPMPGQEMFHMIRQGRLEWRAEVASAELLRMRPGMSATLSAAGGPTVQGRVRMLAPTVDPVTRNGLVYVDIPTAAAQAAGIRAGMFARGQLQIGEAKALSLPLSAVLLREGYSYVMQVGEGNKVIEKKIKIGRREGERVEIIEGLKANDAVIASGLAFLTDGDVVRVVGQAAAR
jgi:HlyD family secretion protein